LLHNALKAKNFYHRNINYIVDESKRKVVIIDELTGRLVPNRVYGAGIHQAIESKENLPVSYKSKITATITYQSFFRLFDKLSGMTGTAESEAEEFRQVYGMEVVSIPPYKKMIRRDCNDLLFWDRKSKYRSIIELIKKNNETKKRPILIGSPSVEISEHLSSLLFKEGIFHYKLNAINHQHEAEIITQAGQFGIVTISTNMAGRGTDIVLSEESKKAGGLLVIGVERNVSRRIDDQLRGRSGRQGDPGESQFYVSLEDELLKGIEMKERLGDFFYRQIKEAFQRPLSGDFFDFIASEQQESIRNIYSSNRQLTLNYDLLINQQRRITYDYRERLMISQDPRLIIISKKNNTVSKKLIEYLRPLLIKKVDDF
jgi:preprotein translocase subunit SecA